MAILIELLLTFFKIGMFSFGGGYAMISFLQNEAVARGWMTVSEFTDVVAISQITPGPIAVNMATFVGFREAGIPGSLFATLGVDLPSTILVLITIKFITRFKQSKLIADSFYGLRPAAAGLICAAAVQIAWPEFFRGIDFGAFTKILISGIEFRSVAICAAAFIMIYKFKVSLILIIFLSAIAGLLIF